MLLRGTYGWIGVLLCFGMLRAQVEISEFMARNVASLADSDRAFPDWIELRNTSGADLSLDGWYLTDTPTNLTRWRLPAQTLSADGPMVIFASGKNRTPWAGPLHTNFKLPGGGSYLALVKPDGITIATEFAPAYPPQFNDVSCGLNPDPVGPRFLYFERPTPRAANVAGWPSIAGSVTFSQPGGPITTTTAITLTTAEPDSGIWYTVDGSIPTTNSIRYQEPIPVDRSLRIRARVFRDGLVPGPVSGTGFTLVSESQRTFSSNLPLLIVDTHGRTIGEGSRAPCYVTVIEPGAVRSAWNSPVSLHTRGGIEIRGSSSTQFPKHSYGLELDGEDGADRAEGLLGLPKESDWVLYAPYTDKTLIRDVLAYELSNRIGRYAPRTRFVEVYVNTAGTLDGADYQGVYVLVEKIKGGPDRVDIPEVESTDVTEPGISGGYILKKDRIDSNDRPFTTPRGHQLGLEWPRGRDLATNQTLWIRDFMTRFETALYGARYRDATVGYAAYIDADSFIDHQWLVEVAKNIDGYRLSTFMHKDRGGRLNMGPIWDYNLSFGNANYLDGQNPTGWYRTQVGGTDYPWYARLFEDAAYSQRHTDRWVSMRTNALATASVMALVDGYTNLLAEAQQRNFKKWRILGTYVWPNSFIGKTYDDEIGFLKGWTSERLEWIDSTMLRWPDLSHPSGYYPGGVDILITSANPVYFTLDGTDPRTAGGGISPAAHRYSGSFSLRENTQVIARARSGTRWSGPVDAHYATSIPDLRISELMYHPPAASTGSPFDAEDFEFIELRNVGSTTFALPGFKISGGIDYVAPAASGELWPRENVVLARRPEAFESRYGSGVRILGPYTGRLNNSGEALVLIGALGEPIQRFTYSDRWQPATDGIGFSLTARIAAADGVDWNLPGAWIRSISAGGTPGRDDVPEADLRHVSAEWIADSGSTRIALSFDAAAGQTYSVQTSPGIHQGSWTTLTNLPPPEASGVQSVEFPVDGESARVYRVITPRIR